MDEYSFSTAGRPGAQAPLADTDPDPLRMVLSLLSISKSTRAFLTLLLADIGLHLGQDQLIMCIDENQPVSVSDLADRIAVRPSTVSKMLDRLVDKGAVQRIVSTQDARRTMVSLTKAGVALKPRVLQVWARLDGELSAAMSHQEASTVNEALARIELVLAARLRRHR